MASKLHKELLDAGVHFGHLTRKWDPRMAPYIFMEKNGIHIIDLFKTEKALEEAKVAIKNIVKSGRKVMFVATKKQAKGIVTEEAKKHRMPFVTERWLGGMLTNFSTVRKSLKKMASIDKMMKDESYENLAKRERLMITREKEKLQRVLGGISELTRLPAALFIVDLKNEHIAVAEAKKLNIPVFAMVDTNSNPEVAEYPIPANDDAYKSIALVTQEFGKAIEEGLAERKKMKEELKNAEDDADLDEASADAEAPAAEVKEAKAEKTEEAKPAEKGEKPAAEAKEEKAPSEDKKEDKKPSGKKAPAKKAEAKPKAESAAKAEKKDEKVAAGKE